MTRPATLHGPAAPVPDDPSQESLLAALTPDAVTKAAYIGEFKFGGNAIGQHEKVVPWTTIKEIMYAIRRHAAQRDAILEKVRNRQDKEAPSCPESQD
jgi:hypothetical protein